MDHSARKVVCRPVHSLFWEVRRAGAGLLVNCCQVDPFLRRRFVDVPVVENVESGGMLLWCK